MNLVLKERNPHFLVGYFGERFVFNGKPYVKEYLGCKYEVGNFCCLCSFAAIFFLHDDTFWDISAAELEYGLIV